MKIDPGFANHWKVELLIERLGADAVVSVLRLWGNAQIRREFSGLDLTPKRLAMETKWKGDPQELFDVLTDPDAPWLDQDADGTFTIHGFEEHQHQVVKLWKNGAKGGRPKKNQSKTSPSSSSYPICEPNGNQMVSESFELEASPPTKKQRSKSRGTLEELKTFAAEIGVPESDGEELFYRWEGNGWKNGKRAIADWRSTMRNWKQNGFLASQKHQTSPTSGGSYGMP